MWIVKLGGSLLSSGQLATCLSSIAHCGRGRVVIVPGGGIFADQIRRSQRQWAFNDRVAHRMSLLAMEQYACLLQAYAPEIVPCDSRDGIIRALDGNRVPVWLPARMITRYSDLPENWAVTSDSLALWLAQALDAKHLILVKSIRIDGTSARQIAASGKLDRHFPDLIKRSDVAVWWLNAQDVHNLEPMVTGLVSPEAHLHAVT